MSALDLKQQAKLAKQLNSDDVHEVHALVTTPLRQAFEFLGEPQRFEQLLPALAAALPGIAPA